MALQIQPQVVPIDITQDGIAFVANTRLRLETIVYAFRNGDTAEQITENFDTLSLADTYAVIAYYLNHRQEVDAYIQEQEAQAQTIRDYLENKIPESFTLRDRLFQRKQQSK